MSYMTVPCHGGGRTGSHIEGSCYHSRSQAPNCPRSLPNRLDMRAPALPTCMWRSCASPEVGSREPSSVAVMSPGGAGSSMERMVISRPTLACCAHGQAGLELAWPLFLLRTIGPARFQQRRYCLTNGLHGDDDVGNEGRQHHGPVYAQREGAVPQERDAGGALNDACGAYVERAKHSQFDQ